MISLRLEAGEESPIKPSLHIYLYPNPAKDEVTVNISPPGIKDALVTIRDISGRNALSATYDGHATSINTAALHAGLCFVQQVSLKNSLS